MSYRTVEDCGSLDILLVPGGPGTRREVLNREVIDWLAQSEPHLVLASDCTGARLLAEAGRLDNLPTTIHSGSHEWLARYEQVTVRPEARYVDKGFIATSAGVSAGIDVALHLVEHIVGEARAWWAARVMEYERGDA